MRRRRAVVAHELLESQRFTIGTAEVLNFFELLGFFVYVARVLDVDEAMNHFSGWLTAYWYTCESFIAEARRRNAGQAENYAKLVMAFRSTSTAELSPSQLLEDAKGTLRMEARVWPPPTTSKPQPRAGEAARDLVRAVLRRGLRPKG